MSTPDTTSNNNTDPIKEQESAASVFTEGKWYKIGSSAMTKSIGTLSINEIFTIKSIDEATGEAVLKSIRGEQTAIHKSLLETLGSNSLYELVPIALGDKFRIPNETTLEEMGVSIPNHIRERISGPGAILKVIGIWNNGGIIEVSLWNGNSFIITPEVLSKFKRKRTKSKKA